MDSTGKIVSCMQQAARFSGLPVPSNKEAQHIIGLSLFPAIKQLFGIDEEQAKEVVENYKRAFVKHDQVSCEMFGGVMETLDHLAASYTLGVATGKSRKGLTRALNASQTNDYFDATICADEAETKPSPDMLEKLLAKWKIAPNQAVMIGDTSFDMQMAEQIGMQRIGVSYGAHDISLLANHKPCIIIDKIDELKSIL